MELDFNYSSVAGIVAAAEQAGLPISRLVLNQQALQMEQSEESIYEHMKAITGSWLNALNQDVRKTCAVPADSQAAAPTRCAGLRKAAQALPAPSFQARCTAHWLFQN